MDGCPDEQKKLSMKNRHLARPKALAVFLCLNSKAPTSTSRGGFVLPVGNNRYACHTAHHLSIRVYHK